MDLKDLDRSIETALFGWVLAVWRQRVIFIVTSLLVFALIMFATLAIQPIYEGAALLLGDQSSQPALPTGSPQAPQATRSLLPIAESDEVVRGAIEAVGLQNFVEAASPNTISIFSRMRAALFPGGGAPSSTLKPIDIWLPRISLGLNVRVEPNTDIIRIAYRNKDPVLSARFANAVADAFVNRQITLFSRPGAAEFFMRQKQRFDDEFKRASDALEKFSESAEVYSTDDQRQLLLKRMSDLASALAATRNEISNLKGQRQALADQLRQLPPVRQSEWVSSLVESLAGDRAELGARSHNSAPINDRIADPALLLVKVYQDSMVALFKANSDIAGAEGKLTQQLSDLGSLTAELNKLTENEETFLTLKRAVDQASYNSDVYSKRMVEEQINAASIAARISPIRIFQAATEPLRPVSPNYVLIFFAGGFASLLAGAGASIVRDKLSGRLRPIEAVAH